MNKELEKRTLTYARHIIKSHDTVRATAKLYNISKSTVHNDIHKRLPLINRFMYRKISKIMDKNFSHKHIIGGQSTKLKYLREKNEKILVQKII